MQVKNNSSLESTRGQETLEAVCISCEYLLSLPILVVRKEWEKEAGRTREIGMRKNRRSKDTQRDLTSTDYLRETASSGHSFIHSSFFPLTLSSLLHYDFLWWSKGYYTVLSILHLTFIHKIFVRERVPESFPGYYLITTIISRISIPVL